MILLKNKKLDTIEDPHNKHTIEDQGCSWATSLKNCLGAGCTLGFNEASYILLMGHNLKNMFLQTTAGHNRGPPQPANIHQLIKPMN
jgi:hypothetical protein